MKKRLEADLISIAHRILQLKNKSDVNQLFLETQKLYEKLAALRFVEEYFGEPKPTIGQAEVVEKMKEFFETIKMPELQISTKSNDVVVDDATDVIEETSIEEEKANNEATVSLDQEVEVIEADREVEIIANESLEPNDVVLGTVNELVEIEDIVGIEEEPNLEVTIVPEEIKFNPIVEEIEAVLAETPKKTGPVQISFEDLLGGNYIDTQFVKVTPSEKQPEVAVVEPNLPFDFQKEVAPAFEEVALEKEDQKSTALNDKLVKGINIGLNDRVAFVKHLFGGNNEDYNRVLNQLITLDTFQETKAFIDEMVKPDYNNWDGKEEYENRFMEIIEKKFLSF